MEEGIDQISLFVWRDGLPQKYIAASPKSGRAGAVEWVEHQEQALF